MNIWAFIQNQLLGMEWLNSATGFCLKKCGLDITTRMGGSLHFFCMTP